MRGPITKYHIIHMPEKALRYREVLCLSTSAIQVSQIFIKHKACLHLKF